jgi:hypothetical protein
MLREGFDCEIHRVFQESGYTGVCGYNIEFRQATRTTSSSRQCVTF